MTDDEKLRQLLTDAVSDVEPDDRITRIRAQVRSDPKVVPMSHARSWRHAAVGIVATAAVIGVVAYVASTAGHDPDVIVPSGNGGTGGATATATDTAGPSTPPSSAPSSPTAAVTGTTDGTKAVAVYYVGTDPRDRPVLYREFHQAPDYPTNVVGSDRDLLTVAVRDAMTTLPLDPDYDAPWIGTADLDYASYDTTGAGSTLRIALRKGAPTQRPADMTSAEARAAVQQLVYTAQGAIGKRVPVVFTIGRQAPPANPTLLGVDISRPIPAAPLLRTLALVNISDPNEGAVVSGRLVVTGVANTFEGNVVVYLERGGQKFAQRATIAGWGPGRLFPWKTTIDLGRIVPGQYTLVATDGGDAAGTGRAWIDTRTVEVK